MATEIESMLNDKDLAEQWSSIPNSTKLHELYEFRGDNHIINYLQSHSELIDFLLESYYYLEMYFGASAKFSLEDVHDPEAQHDQLMVYINTPLPVDEALDCLDRFDNYWFLYNIEMLGHLINFNLENEIRCLAKLNPIKKQTSLNKMFEKDTLYRRYNCQTRGPVTWAIMTKSIHKFITSYLLISFIIASNAFPQHQSGQVSLSQRYNNALELMGSQHFDQAISALKSIIAEDPSFGKAYFKIFEAYKWKNDLDAGLHYFELLDKKHPANPFSRYGIGLIFKEKKQWEKAIQQFDLSLQSFPEYPKLFKDYIDLMNQSDQLDQAFQQINGIIQANPDQATAHFALGYWHQLQRNWEKGLKNLDHALQLNPKLFDAYLGKGAILWYTSRFQEFLQISQLGLKLAEQENDLEFQCNFLGHIGLAYMYLSNFDESEKYCYQSLRLAFRIGNKTEQARNLGNLGVIYRDKGRYQEALDLFDKAIVKARQIGDHRREGLFLRNIGSIYSLMGENLQAIRYLQQALPITVEVGDRNSESLVRWSLGIAYQVLGDYDRSIDYTQQALNIATEINDRWGQARYLGSIGLNYWYLGNYSQALEHYNQALNLAKEIGDRSGEADQYGNIAIIYHDLGDFSSGLEYYQQALQISREIGDKTGEARQLGNIGVLYNELRDYQLALQNYQQALKIYREIGNRLNESLFLGNIGYLFIDTKDFISSKNYIYQALEIARHIQDKKSEASQYINLGDLFLMQQDYKAALVNFKQGFETGESIKNPKLVIEGRFGMARCYEALNQLSQAFTSYQFAIEEIEKLRGELPTEKFKIGFLENKLQIYEGIISVLAKLTDQHPTKKFDRLAFQYAERAKARSQLDIVYQGKVFHNLAEIPTEFKQKLLIHNFRLIKKCLHLNDKLLILPLTRDEF